MLFSVLGCSPGVTSAAALNSFQACSRYHPDHFSPSCVNQISYKVAGILSIDTPSYQVCHWIISSAQIQTVQNKHFLSYPLPVIYSTSCHFQLPVIYQTSYQILFYMSFPMCVKYFLGNTLHLVINIIRNKIFCHNYYIHGSFPFLKGLIWFRF